MLCEGNIEQYSFYLFGELTTFFSASFRHKLVNLFLLAFFFVVVFSATALYLWFWSSYKKRLGYFVDNSKLTSGGVIGYTIDKGVVCLLFGAAHQLLLASPNLQLLVLGLI
jgi:hypothetical protein